LKNIKGILFIILTTLITFLLWWFAVPQQEIVALDRARHIIAGLALNGFFLNFLLATRNKTVEKWFNGLDKMYVYHKYIAIVSLVLLLIHAALGDALKTSDQINIRVVLGGAGMFFFVVIVGITLFDKKLTYEKWRKIHSLMLIPYVIGLTHTYVSSKYNLFSGSALSIWVGVTAIIGLASAIYVIFFYQKTQFKHSGTISKVTKHGPAIVEWEITLDEPIQYRKGQFIFVKVFHKDIDEEPHPFTISGGDGNKIYLTTKASGDFTKQVYDSLEINTKVALAGPYGYFDFKQGKQNQLWIAGGIGITPFMAFLRDNKVEQDVDFYYSYQGEEAGVYKDFLEEYQQGNKNIKIHLVDTSKAKMLDFTGYPLQESTSVFMCGPQKMVESYTKFFKKNYENVDLHFEAFKFR